MSKKAWQSGLVCIKQGLNEEGKDENSDSRRKNDDDDREDTLEEGCVDVDVLESAIKKAIERGEGVRKRAWIEWASAAVAAMRVSGGMDAVARYAR